MAITVYNKTNSDFPNNQVSISVLHNAIQSSPITVKLEGISIAEDESINIAFYDELVSSDLAIFEDIIANHDGNDIPTSDPVVIANIPNVTVRRPVDPVRAYAFSHNWCDKTTWYTMAKREENKIIGIGNGIDTAFVIEEDYPVIEIGRGKITDDHRLRDPDGNNYSVVVEVGTTTGGYTTLAEREPFEEEGGDFWIDYNNPGTEGTLIHFETPPAENENIRVTYYYCDTDMPGHSAWYFMPPPGKKWVIDHVEAQFTSDVGLTDTIIYQAWINHPLYGWMPVPGEEELRYHSAHNYDDYVRGSLPEVPAWGGDGPRGRHVAGRVVQWDYQSSIVLNASQLVAVRVWCKHDRAMAGGRVTITIYAMEEDE